MNFIDFYNEKRFKESSSNRNQLVQRQYIVMNWLKNKAVENNNFLDIGCGNGFFISVLDSEIKVKINYFGIDASSYQINKADNSKFKFLRCNIEEKLPFEDSMFDFIFAGELVEHLYNTDYFFEECSRILKKDGYLIITTPNLNSWYNRIIFLLGIQPMFYEVSVKNTKIGFGFLKKFIKETIPVGHLRIFNVNSLKDMLFSNNFKVLKIQGSIFPRLPKFFYYIDKFFNYFPNLSSDIIIFAKKNI